MGSGGGGVDDDDGDDDVFLGLGKLIKYDRRRKG